MLERRYEFAQTPYPLSNDKPLGGKIMRKFLMTGLSAVALGTTIALSPLLASAAFATMPPTAANGISSSTTVSGYSAENLSGTYGTSGVTTNITFKYGTSSSNLNQSAPGNVSGFAAGTVGGSSLVGTATATISNLTPGTTYYWQFTASSSGGAASGIVMSFTAGPGLPPVTSGGGGSTQAPIGAVGGLVMAGLLAGGFMVFQRRRRSTLPIQ